MSEKEINAYRLTSLEEPTDEMLAYIMREVAEEARRTNERTRCWRISCGKWRRKHAAQMKKPKLGFFNRFESCTNNNTATTSF